MTLLPQTPTLTKILAIDANFFDRLKDFSWISDLLTKLQEYSLDTFDHSLRVGFIISQISLDPQLIAAGLLHDIGKTTIPDGILDKPEINAEEKEMVKAHLREGFEIIKKFDVNVAKIMVAHHEWQEDSYPRKNFRPTDTNLLKQQQILALADSVDALLSTRSYKLAWPKEKVVVHLSQKFPTDEVAFAISADLQLLGSQTTIGP